jgi:hypothetical protein
LGNTAKKQAAKSSRKVATAAPQVVRDVQSFPRLVASEPRSTQQIALADGATVEVHGGAVAEVRDAGGRLLVRYENGRAEIAAPAGDLVLSAPGGRVVVQAATDVVIEAARDLTQKAGHRADVHAERLDVKAQETRVTTGQATVVAERILTTARAVSQTVERLEVSATRLFEKTRETYREAAGLLQTRAGRVRTVVEDTFSVTANRTTLTSKEETSIDGKKVLLG